MMKMTPEEEAELYSRIRSTSTDDLLEAWYTAHTNTADISELRVELAAACEEAGLSTPTDQELVESLERTERRIVNVLAERMNLSYEDMRSRLLVVFASFEEARKSGSTTLN